MKSGFYFSQLGGKKSQTMAQPGFLDQWASSHCNGATRIFRPMGKLPLQWRNQDF